MSLVLILKYWREGLIGLAVVALVGSCLSRDAALKRAGAAEALTKIATDSLHSNAKQIRLWDTVYKVDTLRFTRLASRTDTLRDSVLVHLTDTLRVKEYIAASDSSRRACSVTVGDCARFRQLAETRFNEYESKIKGLETVPHRGPFGLGCTGGAGGVYDFAAKRISAGPGAICGFTYRW